MRNRQREFFPISVMTEPVILSPQNLRAVQLTQLELLCEVRRICKLRNIHYNIIAGTLLGAHRHGGFIPWDDDADVALLREEYEKFRSACENDLNKERYYFQDHRNTEGYRWGYGKLRKKETELVVAGTEHLPYEQGIWIDIFPLDFVPDSKAGRSISNFHCFCIRKLLYSEAGRLREANPFLRFLYAALSKINYQTVFRYYESYILRRNRKKTDWVRILTFPTPNREYGYLCKWYENSTDTVFEKEVFSGISDYGDYLEFKFGNWHLLPPEHQRKQHKISRVKV